MAGRKEVDQLLAELREVGYQAQLQGSGHYHLFRGGKKVRKPNGIPVSIPQSPSDWRWREATLTQLKEAGVSLNGNGGKERNPDYLTRTMSDAEKTAYDMRAQALRKRIKYMIGKRFSQTEISRLGMEVAAKTGARTFTDAAAGSRQMRKFLNGQRSSSWMLDIWEAGMNALEAADKAITSTQEEVKTVANIGGRKRGSTNHINYARADALRVRLKQLIDRLEHDRGLSDAHDHLQARNVIADRAFSLAEEAPWAVTEHSTTTRGVTMLGSLLGGKQRGMANRNITLFNRTVDALNEEMDRHQRALVERLNRGQVGPEPDSQNYDADSTTPEQEETYIMHLENPDLGVSIVNDERIKTALIAVHALGEAGVDRDQAVEIGLKVATA